MAVAFKTTGIQIALAAMFFSCIHVGWGKEPNGVPRTNDGAKIGGRWVGVSCVCHPQSADTRETEKLIDVAALDKPDIILLTEGCMQNTPRSATPEEHNAGAEPLPAPGPITEFLARKAKQHRCYIIAGYWRKDPRGRGRYNSAVLIDRKGELVGWYDKVFPTIPEMQSGVIPGRKAVVFDTDFGRIGAMICFDLNFPELAEQYKDEGIELLCFLSDFRGGEMVPALARKHHWFIASAVPEEDGVIVDPLGRALAKSSHYGRVVFARVNLDSRTAHIDFNVDRVRRMKEKYGPLVRIDTASPEAVYFISSLHPERSINDMMREFEIEDYDAYLDRSRREREKALRSDGK
ncbi:MAG: carbon-nitrogen hydrolase family protein [Pirellulales bacterium]|nr:carbon-nitrogen hydrolase family protein [Pirellulales bacterium]